MPGKVQSDAKGRAEMNSLVQVWQRRRPGGFGWMAARGFSEMNVYKRWMIPPHQRIRYDHDRRLKKFRKCSSRGGTRPRT